MKILSSFFVVQLRPEFKSVASPDLLILIQTTTFFQQACYLHLTQQHFHHIAL